MNRRVLAIAAGAAVVVVLGWYLALWGPRNSELSNQRKRVETADGQVRTLRTQLSRLQAAQRAEPVKRAKLERLRAAVPDDPGLAQFILDTNDAANKAGINFMSIAPTPPTAAPASAGAAPASAGAAPAAGVAPAAGASGVGTRPAEIKVSMTVSGGYSQILDFINRLDGLPRIVVIDSVNVTPGGASTGAAGTPGGAAGPATAGPASGGPLELSVSLTGRMFLTQVPAGFAGSASGAAPGGGATTSTTTAGRGTATTTPSGTTTTTPR